MKLVNSNNREETLNLIDQILEDYNDVGDFFDLNLEDIREPCWQIKIDRKEDLIRFLIDLKEITNFPLPEVDINSEFLYLAMKLFKTKDLVKLEDFLKSGSYETL